jgi:RNA 3'-terminal phosphate cyclase
MMKRMSVNIATAGSNTVVIFTIALAFVLAITAIPLQILGGG